MMSKSSIALPFLLSTTLLASAQQTTTQGNCTIFNWDNNPAYIATYPPQRVSAGGTCPENESNFTCPLTASGEPQYSATNNLTDLSTRFFVPIIVNTLSEANNSASELLAPGFNESVIGAIDQTRLIEPGQSAYLNFTAYRYCFEGTVGNCTEGLENGRAVQVCAPVWHSLSEGGSTVFDGEYTVVNVSANDVEDYRDPYENQVSGEGEDGGNAAAGLRGGANVASAGLFTLMMTLV
ncbi:hypothetical protein ASPCAL03091 [Aspergillus calidoustus]|uniref:Uncharacterized protein n=1 Tax=Aspergillus calidoustus TaxID=454130 RepID=A0A0U5GRK8_ASPCI|nr:hypothetical protein ASPCAL03091 [Aspergillus calidoustus]